MCPKHLQESEAYGRTCINIFVGVEGRQKEEKKGRRGMERRKHLNICVHMFVILTENQEN